MLAMTGCGTSRLISNAGFRRLRGAGAAGSARGVRRGASPRVHSRACPGCAGGRGGRLGASPTASFAQCPRAGRGMFIAVHTRARKLEEMA